ncbi:NAC domain-containing protein 79-like [Forsythia ovata]|uniref:NAC domain-containing protein 79-like n=1 Tax=Forsythia ovata TaxID=205694 RepID=A0ABD1WYY8_9LAMI
MEVGLIIDGNKLVGFKQHLVFYKGKILSGTKSHWNIHEYRVNPGTFTAAKLNDGIKQKISNLVVCKIFLVKNDPFTDSDGKIDEDDRSEKQEDADPSNKA